MENRPPALELFRRGNYRAAVRVCSKINSDFAGGCLAVWLGASDEHTRQRSVRAEQQRQTAKQPQPSGAGRRLAICFVARRSQPTGGDAPGARAEAPRASHLARRRSRQNRKLFLNRPIGFTEASDAVPSPWGEGHGEGAKPFSGQRSVLSPKD